MERKLAAVLFADIVGYSRLMQRDEGHVMRLLQDYRRDVISPLVQSHHGRIVKFMGDGMLVEFPSAINAVGCGHAIQSRLNEAGELLPLERRLVMRIGINLCDVMVVEDDLYGDGVNVAARLQEMAEPGGVWLTEDTWRHVHSKLDLAFEDMGSLHLKNMAEPVHAFRVRGLAADSPNALYPPASATEGGQKPIILVLPFANLSGEAEQEYFCHGLTNDITTELSRFSGLSVISSTTAFAYGTRPLRVREAGKDLGAHYVLEGSVQKSGPRVRLNVQLIDAPDDRHIWAERFERSTSDLFVLQDEIIEHVVGAMALKVEATERARAVRAPIDSPGAYDSFMRGAYFWLLHSLSDETRDTLDEARRWLEASRALDPGYARCWAWLALTHIQEWRQSWADGSALDTAGGQAREAFRLDPDDYQVRWILAYYLLNARQFDHAMHEYEVAVSLNRNEANLLAEYAEALVYCGDLRRGFEVTRQAMRMNPHSSDWYRADLAWMHYLGRDYDRALAEINHLSNPSADAWLIAAACHGQIAALRQAGGNPAAAATALAAAGRALKMIGPQRPSWTIAKERQKSPFRNEDDAEHWLDGLRKAGLPD
jgi:TolB-like protein/class 3 adenylate cyclase